MAKRKTGAERERLSRGAIIAGAIVLADREGLDAVTIRRLAHEHGVTPMALYWHFREKGELLAGIAEHLFDQVELPGATDQPWHVQLDAVLRAFLTVIRRHPAIAGLALPRILACESGLLLAERVLSLLRTAGFSAEQAGEVGRYLVCAIITLVTVESDDAEAHQGEMRTETTALGTLSPERYPNIVASADVLVSCQNPDDYFTRGVDLLVQGTRGIAPG
jgi:AcrR family transcriptional regulator